MQLLDEASKNNRAWYTRYEDVGDLGYTFELSDEQKNREEERDKYMAHMRTQQICWQRILSKYEKVNVVGEHNRYEDRH